MCTPETRNNDGFQSDLRFASSVALISARLDFGEVLSGIGEYFRRTSDGKLADKVGAEGIVIRGDKRWI